MPAKRSLTLALALLLAVALPVRGATVPTIQQIDLRPMADSSGPGPLVSFKDRLYFAADDGTHGLELWRTDGAPDDSHTGTELVCDLFSGAGNSFPRTFSVLGDWLYFTADAGIARYRLYRTNGSVGSCEVVSEPWDFGSTYELRAVGDQLWFGVLDSTDGVEPAMTTAAGAPAVVFNINPSGNSNPGWFTKLGSHVYFAADNGTDGVELWKSNGTGATMVADIDGAAGQGPNPAGLLTVGDTLYFAGTHPSGGNELMHATVVGYTGYFDINAGPDNSNPQSLTNFNGQLYFTAFTADAGWELWRVNSSGTSVERVMDILPGTVSSYPNFLTPIGDWLYFNADDGVNGYELWRTDGTTTEMVKDIWAGASSSYPFGFVEHGGAVFFIANTGTAYTAFQTTGTAESTVEALTTTGTNPYVGCECSTALVFVGDRLFTYLGNTEYGYEVAFVDPLLPSTNRDGSGFTTALLIGAALTAAAGLTLRMRAAQQQ